MFNSFILISSLSRRVSSSMDRNLIWSNLRSHQPSLTSMHPHASHLRHLRVSHYMHPHASHLLAIRFDGPLQQMAHLDVTMCCFSLHELRSISMFMSPIRQTVKPPWQTGTLRPFFIWPNPSRCHDHTDHTITSRCSASAVCEQRFFPSQRPPIGAPQRCAQRCALR